MRTIKTVLVLTIALWFTAPAVAQTRTAPETMTSSVPINAYMVGAGVLALATASGLINMYNAGFMLFEGAPLTEALEVGTGLPLLAATGVVILGGIYGQDSLKQIVAPLFASNIPIKPTAKPNH